ncbi:FliI/YscN family ATPase [Rickettsia endosymbiont of Cardiosporidium cionae]|uniref:FliI/YscN family ATPase n=1 Tax=Rickettsia endosymbiont of Cardiosporidium cionae TaxID=2777155 RepID=UPI0018931B09|nr:FliI/YscN family ATPase [Rickettsia endosymbiont of Cardiosporidium cionae]KAF8818974.1 F0F1 ATP synthase subunit beta [Rickettsia endosymbiont of Cardiosporidium cionae]
MSVIDDLKFSLDLIPAVSIYGKIIKIHITTIECVGIERHSFIGSICSIEKNKKEIILSEVIGFNKDVTILMPFGDIAGLSTGSEVRVLGDIYSSIYPDMTWLGRMLDAFGNPIDDYADSIMKRGTKQYQLRANVIPSQKRNIVGNKVEMGIKAIDIFASCCRGQRMGIFSGSGVGKSVLISMLTRNANFDVKIIGLIGERSRESKEFINKYLGKEGLKNAVIVVANGNESALMRKRATYLTMTIAEYFRDQNKEVLCIIDSMTRFAMAQREIGLALGEAPTSKGYTASVFSELPKILERAGPGTKSSSITGLFSVLVEGDDHNEPISDAMRGVLDGHIVLNRSIAERNRYPAVDILKSISRMLPGCNTELQNRNINRAKKYIALYEDMSDLIKIGAYKHNSNPEVDLAIKYYRKIDELIRQAPDEYCSIEDAYQALEQIISN